MFLNPFPTSGNTRKTPGKREMVIIFAEFLTRGGMFWKDEKKREREKANKYCNCPERPFLGMLID